MGNNILTIADLTMNAFFQDYANGAEFFDIDDFVNYTGIAYGDLVSQEYDIERKRMYQMGEDDIVSFSHDWLKTEVLKREKDIEGFFIKLSQPIMSFVYDRRDVGIQNIFPVGTQFKYEFIRDSIDTIWQNEYIPLTKKVFWALLEDKIYFTSNLVEPALTLKVVYVPAVSPDLEIPLSRQKMVIQNTLQLMREAAKVLVKETNNQNLNELPVTENDRNLIKQ